MILGRWLNQGWQLEFEPYESEFGEVHYYADDSPIGTMQYRIFFDAAAPVLNIKEGNSHDVSYVIKEFAYDTKTLTVFDLNRQELLVFKKI